METIHESSKNIHINILEHLESHHGGKYSIFIKNIIFGGIDGVITTFSIITASYAADLNIKVILILGLSNVLADGFSMGFGEYASSYSEMLHFQSEQQKEITEYEENFDFEKQELTHLYMSKGLNEKDAESIVNILSKPKNKDIFIDHMMLLELNIPKPDDHKEVITKSVVTCVSFYLFGLFPLIVYILAKLVSFQNKDFIYGYTCIICAITLFCIGSIGSYISKQPMFSGGFITLSNGVVASTLAYAVGYFLNYVLD
jgi:VIT1/CCC1 family predicted Fe2+/Mn2+ transporter